MKLVVFAVMLMVVYGHHDGSDHRDEALGDASSDFAQRLIQEVSLDKKSMVLSPLSIHASLSMALAGARNETAEEMESVLNVSSIPDVNDAYRHLLEEYKPVLGGKVNMYTVMLVNSQRPVEEDFKNVVENKYFAKVWPINVTDPKAEKEVNEYVEEKTEGQIKDIIKKDSIDVSTSVILVNTLTLNATWQKRFSESNTRKQEFTCHGGNTIEVDMMNDTRRALFKRDNESDADVVYIPFAGGQLGFFAIIPLKYDGLSALEKRFANSGELKKVLDKLRLVKVELSIPKFRLETRLELEDGLRKLGMKKAFTPNVADFNGIIRDEYLSISHSIHGAVIDIDENGSLTAGATAPEIDIDFVPRGQEEEKKEEEMIEAVVTADKPFMFVIQDSRNKQNLFQGKFTGEK